MLEEKIDTLVATLESLIKVLDRSPTSMTKESPSPEQSAKPAAPKAKAEPATKPATKPAADVGTIKADLIQAAIASAREHGMDATQKALIEAVGHPKIADYTPDELGKAAKALEKVGG